MYFYIYIIIVNAYIHEYLRATNCVCTYALLGHAYVYMYMYMYIFIYVSMYKYIYTYMF